jgi:cation diffusion facilitator CzcD-associated flavoprotein CzcO
MDVQLRCFPGRKKENHENLQWEQAVYRFGSEQGTSQTQVYSFTDTPVCSVLRKSSDYTLAYFSVRGIRKPRDVSIWDKGVGKIVLQAKGGHEVNP